MNRQLSPEQAMRYSRQLMLPALDFRGQEALLASKVLLVGVGGLGCAAAPYLVASGIGSITLADSDVVEFSNLQRQILYREADIGLEKALRAKAMLQGLNNEIEIVALQQRLSLEVLEMIVPQYSIVLDCSDNLVTRRAVNRACFIAKVPLVSGAAIRFEGQVASFDMHEDRACYQCLSEFYIEREMTCMEAGILSPVVGVVGVMLALEAVKILGSVGRPLFGKLQMFDALNSEWRQFKLKKNTDCPICNSQS